jgi:DegV family protein with EDD domain
MPKTAIVTDSNSGITQEQAKELGLYVIPMPFFVDGKEYLEGIELTHEMFYQKQEAGADIKTSQPSPASVTDTWDKLLNEHDEVVYIPMSSALSTSCNTARMLAGDYDGKVQVVDNGRISVTLRQAVLDAAELAHMGVSAVQIKEYSEKERLNSSIYLMVNTMTYLKKGGRVTPAAAMIGSVLNIKPVLSINGEKLDKFAKPRGVKQAKQIIIDAVKTDLSTRFSAFSSPDKMHLQMAYTRDLEPHLEFKKEVEAEFPGYPIRFDPVPLSIATHIGPGVIALTCTKKLDYKL